MLSEDMPKNPQDVAELYFGKGKVPPSKEAIRIWLKKHGAVSRTKEHTGATPDSWHINYWAGNYYLVYITSDDRLHSLRIPHYDYYAKGEDATTFNGGRGWACEQYYELSYVPSKQGFGFINWIDSNPFDTK